MSITPRYADAADLRPESPTEISISMAAGRTDPAASNVPGAFRNPPGFYVSVIRDNVPVPAGFETSRMRRLCNDARRAQEEQVAEEQRFVQLYDEYRRQELAQRLEATPEAEFLAIWKKKRREYQQQFRNLPGPTLDDLGQSGACAEIEKTLQLMSFDEFTAALRAGQKVP